jgi:hypothetical protein
MFDRWLPPARRPGSARAQGVVPGGFPAGEIVDAIGTPVSDVPANNGHNPLTCSGQAESHLGTVAGCGLPVAVCLHHRPGLMPNRFLKQVLNSPKWLNPHCAATLITFALVSRKTEAASCRRISILNAPTEKPKN